MTTTHPVIPHLPYLRRYARALTGSQASGDAAVRATLEAVIQDPSLIEPRGRERVGVYRVFHVIWTTSESPGRRRAANQPRPQIGQRLATLGIIPREALLLTMMEGFSPEDTAAILNCTVQEVVQLVEAAMAELRVPIPASILIIEDEPVISLDLSQLVMEMGHSVFAVARTRAEALAAVAKGQPELIVADVQLADNSSGIDAVADILQKCDIPAIFVTAFPERLLTGDRPEPAYVITKPFVPENLKTVVGHALSMADNAMIAA